ncbi:corrinoid protein [Desulfobacula sp.]|mgnify:FL=1|jgi:trimethylamine corrinoid protein|uniref:corrinoid protein n=1 Tax=Desulfobacula sp. TaxID=2593537 RepID=UPI001D5F93F6|nr:corrinoid protein [Desulfobacula sp.]MBT6751764.1 corrinoid protein [Desulfobacula sp.]MBT7631757.1 corrinoid protein [Desulfobacula sp.]
MEKAEYMKKATQYIVDADEEAVEKLARDYLEDGFDPLEMIEKGLSEGIRKLGDLFDRGEVFLPHLIIASEAMTAAVKILEQAMPADQVGKKLAKVVIGTIEGDVHDIGKGIVATMLRVYGFEVIDLGRDVPIATFVEKAKEVGADVVGSSALMTTTMAGQKALEQALKDAGLRDNLITMLGGAATTEHWAAKIGANFWAESAGDTVMKLKETFS